MNSCVDSPTHIRPGEELPNNILQDYLTSHLPSFSGQLSVRQFPAGFSNLTYLLDSGRQRWVLRRPPFGTKAATAHDMSREWRILSALENHFSYIPTPIHYCDDEQVIGSSFYLMEYVEGTIVRKDYPAALKMTPERIRRQCEASIDLLAGLHTLDYQQAGLGTMGKPAGYTARQLSGWSKRYEAARTPDAADFRLVMQWLADNMPGDSAYVGLIHNDFKLDNIVWSADDPAHPLAVLDWEMTTVGDPLMDLGCTLGYWVQADDPVELQQQRMLPTNVTGAMSRQEVMERYQEKSGFRIKNINFYYLFGLFRLAVILQQIYFRFYHGQTKDQRFAQLIKLCRALENTALLNIHQHRL